MTSPESIPTVMLWIDADAYLILRGVGPLSWADADVLISAADALDDVHTMLSPHTLGDAHADFW